MFSFPETCRRGDKLRLGWGSWGILCFSSYCAVDSFNGASVFGSRGGWIVEGVTFSQLCCDRSWKRTMAATCNDSVVGGSGDHVRDVALIVAVKKTECENDVYFFKRPDYTAEEWRWLFLTAGSDRYLHSLRLLGFCGVAGINWAVVTRMRECGESANEHYFASLPQDACSVLHYMRPQFRFLIYVGLDDERVRPGAVRFFHDAEKVVGGDAGVWGSPVVVDGVPLFPDVECLVPVWLREEFLVRTSDLSTSEGHHYVYPGVRGPLLLPSDYIRKYFSLGVILFVFYFDAVVVFLTF
jgi:hypothetical protein